MLALSRREEALYIHSIVQLLIYNLFVVSFFTMCQFTLMEYLTHISIICTSHLFVSFLFFNQRLYVLFKPATVRERIAQLGHAS